jgi:hypothetical protein
MRISVVQVEFVYELGGVVGDELRIGKETFDLLVD